MGNWLALSVQWAPIEAGRDVAGRAQAVDQGAEPAARACFDIVTRLTACRQLVLGPRAVVTGQQPAARSICSDRWDGLDRHHDVSILTVVAGVVGQ
jgi:hypothetical protein